MNCDKKSCNTQSIVCFLLCSFSPAVSDPCYTSLLYPPLALILEEQVDFFSIKMLMLCSFLEFMP